MTNYFRLDKCPVFYSNPSGWSWSNTKIAFVTRSALPPEYSVLCLVSALIICRAHLPHILHPTHGDVGAMNSLTLFGYHHIVKTLANYHISHCSIPTKH